MHFRWLWVLAIVGLPVLFAADNRPSILLIIADDWGRHAGVYGDPCVQTPHFDQLAKDGLLFNRAYCASPSCTPSRGSLLTGRAVHQLEAGGNLWSYLPKKFESYPEVLAKQGYVIGKSGKCWGPGKAVERQLDPGGPNFKDFGTFLNTVGEGVPFCFVLGSSDPHRPYEADKWKGTNLTPEKVRVPAYFPDLPEVRSDMLDYYFEVQRFDAFIGAALKQLKNAEREQNTLVIVTSDNGMPFPRCKANLYDGGTAMPLAVRWPAKIKAGLVSNDFVSLTDIAPTVLEAVGLAVPAEMTGVSWLPIFENRERAERDKVFVERERHANVRKGDLSYPVRAIRTKDFMYIRNLRPEAWPAGDPEKWKAVGEFGDIDPGETKNRITASHAAIANGANPESTEHRFYKLACAKRPAEELYDVARDPDQVENVAEKPEYAEVKKKLRGELDEWMKRTGDPRAEGVTDVFDTYPYFGNPETWKK